MKNNQKGIAQVLILGLICAALIAGLSFAYVKYIKPEKNENKNTNQVVVNSNVNANANQNLNQNTNETVVVNSNANANTNGTVVINGNTNVNSNTNTAAVTNINSAVNSNTNNSVSDTWNLTLVKKIDTGDYAINFVIVGNYLYVANGSSGIQIIDITRPESAKILGSNDPRPSEDYTRFYDIAIFGSIAALTSSEASAGPYFFDISDAENPKYLGYYSKSTFNEDGGIANHSVAIAGNYAYFTQENAGFKIINISNPANPQLLSRLDTPGKPTDVVVLNNIAYIADSRLYEEPGRLIIVDVSDPVNPVQLSSTITGGKTESLSISGNYAYIANSTDGGVKIYDISNPRLPKAVGNAEDINAEDVYAVNNKIYVATRSNRISAFDVSFPEKPELLASSYENTRSFEITASGDYVYVTDDGKISIFKLSK